jgi:hypothetical protein
MMSSQDTSQTTVKEQVAEIQSKVWHAAWRPTVPKMLSEQLSLGRQALSGLDDLGLDDFEPPDAR